MSQSAAIAGSADAPMAVSSVVARSIFLMVVFPFWFGPAPCTAAVSLVLQKLFSATASAAAAVRLLPC